MTESTRTWWPSRRQDDWQTLPPADVDWLVVWNVNLGGGRRAFSVQNRYWGNRPFQAGTVAPTQAWVWLADGVDAPGAWDDVEPFGGIQNLMELTRRGVPLKSGTVLVTPHDAAADPVASGDAVADLVALARALDDEVAARGGAWCPALVGAGDHTRFGIAHQRSVDSVAAQRAAERLGIDDVIVVDPFADRQVATAETPRVFVRGRRDGTGRRARAGRERLAHVPVPPALDAVKRVGDVRHHDRSHEWRTRP